MLKKILKTMVIGGAALTIAATSAQAARVDINLYGASAQFLFWTASAPVYLADTTENGGYGCDGGVFHAVASKANALGRDAGIAVCNGDTAIDGVSQIDGSGTKDTLVIRYTSKASYDGIYAILDDNSLNSECAVAGQRRQPVLDSGVVLGAGGAAAGNSIPNLACMDVHIGASDVAASTFGQASYGRIKGHNSAEGTEVTRSIYNVPTPPAPTYVAARPIVVPFGFFANNDPSTPVPFDNITRPMAANIFSGQITNWNKFGVAADLPMVVCLRHAGSGTHATLDAGVLRGDVNVIQVEVPADDFGVEMGWTPVVWFNDGSSDEIKCVGQNVGAIGYADVDKCGSKCAGGDYGYAKSMTYNGVA
ncbi:MAG: substrate-binding domain-containing protein, partial [Proteobacteria bacterium]|nr:substrate-binding domain-containing protein [Pseudomonadota bacterium]